MQSKSRGDFAYTFPDGTGKVDEAALEPLKQMEKIIRLRVIR